MKNETRILKFFRVYFKIFTVIWFAILAVFACFALITDSVFSVLPMIFIMAIAGGVIFRMQMHSIVEIVINGEFAELERFDKRKGTVRLDEIVSFKESGMGPVLVLAGGKKLRSMNGPFRMVIVNGTHVTREFRSEDFPYTEFHSMR